MGVPGLTTFIDAHKHRLLVDHSLHGGRVIIDGNNLYHFLYYYYHVRHECGGDYDGFSAACVAFFAALRDCHVSPCVIFDGAHHEDGRKFRTSLKRAAERVHLAGFLSVGNRAKILPILAYETFRDVLDEMQVEHVTCYLEADEQIAGLAREWRCPVMTNDSDFFVYDLPGGVILLDYMNLAVKQTAEVKPCEHCGVLNGVEQVVVRKCLNVQVYYLDHLLTMTKLRERQMIPLAATLIGNDVVNKRHFEPFYAKVKLSKVPNGKQGAKASNVAGLFDWLGRTDGLNDAIGQVLTYLDNDKRDAVKSLINSSIDSYTKPQCIIENLLTSSSLIQGNLQSAVSASAPLAFGGHALPDWFLERVRAGALPACALSVVTRCRVILLAQIEVMCEPSAYDCSRPLRACFYSILLNLDGGHSGNLSVIEHDREQKILKGKKVMLVDELAIGVPVPKLDEVPDLSVQYRCSLIESALSGTSISESRRRDFLSQLPMDIQLLVLTICYWALYARPKINSVHARALLVCCLALGAFDRWFLGSTDSDLQNVSGIAEKRVSVSKVAVEISPQSMKDHAAMPEIKDNTDLSLQLHQAKASLLTRFGTAPRFNKANVFDGRIIHAFSQFQTCLQATIHLTQLLLLPSSALLNPALIFNGTCLYNLVRELETRVDVDLYVEQLMGRGSHAASKLRGLFGVIDSLLPGGSLRSVSAASGAGKRSKKTKVKAAAAVSVSEDFEKSIEDSSEGESIEDNCERLKAKVDLDNKFSCLDICDD